MKVNVRYATRQAPVKIVDNETIERLEQTPFAFYAEQLLLQEERQMAAEKVRAITAHERDLLGHLKAAFVYFQHYRTFDSVMAQTFCGNLTQYEQVTDEVVLKKVYDVTINEILIADAAQDIALLEGQFLRAYHDGHQWFYVVMENI